MHQYDHLLLSSLRHRDARTLDLSLKSVFMRAKRLEKMYAVQLRSVAALVDSAVRGMYQQGASSAPLVAALRQYAQAINPWARHVGERMVAEVAARDDRSWQKAARLLGSGVAREIATAPTGEVFRSSLARQVDLITSLPTEAAQRVHELTTGALGSGVRASEVAARVMETGEVTRSRATLIARTETARTSTEFTKARAEHAGSPGYIWRTAGDYDVRESHRKLNGTFHKWSEPPVCDPPDHRAHPGCIWNCRCYAEPLLSSEDPEQYTSKFKAH